MVAGGAGVLLNVEHRNKQWELTSWSRNGRKCISGWNGATQVTLEMSALHSIDDVLCHEHPFQHWCGRLPRASSLLGLGSILQCVSVLVNMSTICVIHYTWINAMNLADRLVCEGLQTWEKMPLLICGRTQKKTEVLPRMIITPWTMWVCEKFQRLDYCWWW